jgi:3-hydroxyisobutyrate dehydrogenase-like beta-hydroxyacid dehydrogenase
VIVGFIGLGAMGMPMMLRLAAAGHSIVAHDVDRNRLDGVSAVAGVRAAGDLRLLAADCDAIVSCLPSVAAVEAVYFSSDGLLAQVRAGSLVVDCSTVGQAVAVRLGKAVEARDAEFLEAPMFGAEARAVEGKLFILAGGTDVAFRRAEPLLRQLAGECRHFGPVGSANAVKVAQNGLGLVQACAIAIALDSIRRAGVDPERFVEVVMRAEGMAASPLLGYLAPRMLADTVPDLPAYPHIMLKDIDLALAMAGPSDEGEGLLSAARTLVRAIQGSRYSDDGFQAMARCLDASRGAGNGG